MLNNAIAVFAAPTPPVTNSWESIATYTVGVGGQSSIDFTSIPSGYKHLQVRGFTRDSRAGQTWSALYGTINNSSSAIYSRHALLADGGTIGAQAGASEAGASYGMAAGSTAASGTFAPIIIDFLDYGNTNKYKTVRYLNGLVSPYMYFGSYVWQSTAAITSLQFTPLAPNFVQYSTLALYGIKG